MSGNNVIEFFDGFDHYQDPNWAGRKWDSSSPVGTASLVPGRLGGNALNVTTGSGLVLTPNQLTSQQTRTIGFAMCLRSPMQSNTMLLKFTDNGLGQVAVFVSSTGQLQVYADPDSLTASPMALIGNSAGLLLSPNTWYYIEFAARIGPVDAPNLTHGGVELRLNGNPVIVVPGNTQSTSNLSSNGIRLSSPCSSCSFDDVYVLNTALNLNVNDGGNPFLGQCWIPAILPSADNNTTPSTNQTWTPSSGTDHYACVDDPSPDSDTSYIQSQTVGQIDTFVFPASSPGAIIAVQSVIAARSDSSSGSGIASVIRSGGSNFSGSTLPLTNLYDMFCTIYPHEPTSGTSWSQTSLDAAEFGVTLSQ